MPESRDIIVDFKGSIAGAASLAAARTVAICDPEDVSGEAILVLICIFLNHFLSVVFHCCGLPRSTSSINSSVNYFVNSSVNSSVS